MGIKYFNINMLQIMKKNILPLLMAVVALCSCSDEDLGGFSGVKTGEVIDFGVSAVKTRANYTDGIDSKQVRWEAGDVVRIYYVYTNTTGNVENTSADYIVTPVDGEIGEHKKLGSLVAKDVNNPLKWADGSGHKFYAVYPADNKITIDEKGVATFPINRDQKCTIRTLTEKEKEDKKYTFVAEPDDKNIYMVASATAGPQSGSVWLDFKPIMTTINVVVKGPQNLTADGEPDDNTVPGSVTVTGVSLISTITTNTDVSKSEFKYNITDGKITGSGSASGTETATEQTETTFISVVNTDGLNAIEMDKGETLVLTGFLPPMDDKTAEALKRKVQIRVHTTGGNKTMTLEKATALLPSAKGAIKLPSMYTPITGSNWITPLDDDIYVSQLSIPGTHDSGTYYCEGFLGSTSGRCQQLTIPEQLKMGIRFFDIRPTGSDLHIAHGLYGCYKDEKESELLLLSDVYTYFNEFLEKNPGEFIITILRWEEEDNDDENVFNSAMIDFVKKSPYTTYALPRTILDEKLQDLTVGDMRKDGQGKILTIMRPNQGSQPDWYFYGSNSTQAPAGMMFISGFPGSHATGTQQAYLKDRYVDYKYTYTSWGSEKIHEGNGKTQWENHTNWLVYCQNYYEVCTIYNSDGLLGSNSPLLGASVNTSEEQAVSNKLTSVKTFIDYATNNNSNAWVINHCSGYRGSNAIFSAYAQLAEDLNPNIYKHIIEREPGCLGMILLDFVGTRQYSSHNVYGDLLPQTIIDNNYKYRMKRKGE